MFIKMISSIISTFILTLVLAYSAWLHDFAFMMFFVIMALAIHFLSMYIMYIQQQHLEILRKSLGESLDRLKEEKNGKKDII